MLGYSEEELNILNWQDITHPDDIDLNQKALQPLLSGEKNSTRFVKRYIHKNGSIVWGDVSTTLRRDNNGNAMYYLTSVNDITERKQAEEKILQQLDELRRWQEFTLGREDRNRQLKKEVNELLKRLGEPIRYPSQEGDKSL
jgi:PAS domain S-box-containing protein